MNKLTYITVLSALFSLGCEEPAVVLNDQPLADAGDAITQPADQRIELDGRASYDKNGDVLEYHWTFDYLPESSALDEMTSPFAVNHTTDGTTSFQPDAVGTYIVKLEVFDGKLYSDPSFVVVNATAPDEAPTADAGPDQELLISTAVTLDGSGSSDPLGGLLNYQWTLVETPNTSSLTQAALSSPTEMTTSFTGDAIGWYTATLVVDNGLSSSVPDSVRVHYTGENAIPVADAGGDIDDMDCKDIQLDCSGSADPEGEDLSYWWILQSKPDGSMTTNQSISDQHAAAPTFWADVAGEYTISCSVFDGISWSYPDTITMNIAERDYNTPPSVNAGADQDIDAGDVTCESTTSPYWPYTTTWTCDSCEDQTTTVGVTTGDADGDPYVVEWIVERGGKGATIVGTDRVPVTVVVEPPSPTKGGQCKDTDYDFKLRAEDCTGAVSEDDVRVTVECCGVGS